MEVLFSLSKKTMQLKTATHIFVKAGTPFTNKIVIVTCCRDGREEGNKDVGAEEALLCPICQSFPVQATAWTRCCS
jgi:hypothetical protein